MSAKLCRFMTAAAPVTGKIVADLPAVNLHGGATHVLANGGAPFAAAQCFG
jgi:hypothetical protein